MKPTAAFHAKIAAQRIHHHAGGAKELVYLHQNRRHLHPERHLCHLVARMEVSVPKWKVCDPDMWIYILLFLAPNSEILIQIVRIANSIMIIFQICWLMKDNPLLSTQCAAWWFSWHPFCRWQLLFDRTWQWRRELIQGNGIFEFYQYLQLADSLKYILKDIFIGIITEQCSDNGEHTWTG